MRIGNLNPRGQNSNFSRRLHGFMEQVFAAQHKARAWNACQCTLQTSGATGMPECLCYGGGDDLERKLNWQDGLPRRHSRMPPVSIMRIKINFGRGGGWASRAPLCIRDCGVFRENLAWLRAACNARAVYCLRHMIRLVAETQSPTPAAQPPQI